METSKRKYKRTKKAMTVGKKAASPCSVVKWKHICDIFPVKTSQDDPWNMYIGWRWCIYWKRDPNKKQNIRRLVKSLNGMTFHHTRCTCVCDYVSLCGVSCWIPPLRFQLSNQGPESKQSAAGEACLSNLQLHSYSKMTLNYIPGLKLRLQPAM